MEYSACIDQSIRALWHSIAAHIMKCNQTHLHIGAALAGAGRECGDGFVLHAQGFSLLHIEMNMHHGRCTEERDLEHVPPFGQMLCNSFDRH